MNRFARFLAFLLRTKWPARGAGLLAVLMLLASIALVVEPLVPQLLGSGKGMDYPLWFRVGQRMLRGGPLQEYSNGGFDFLYTPFAALLLAIPAYFGKTAMVAFLALLNLAAWWGAIVLSNRLSADTAPVSPWVIAVPVAATLAFVNDQFNLGQPNLLLLALLMSGFWLLRRDRGWLAGMPFAIAAAIKAFPVLILPYLLWRGFWRTAASMVVLTTVFLVVVPGAIRGFERNWAELDNWVHGMLLSADDSGFAQRQDTWSRKNQSLYAVEQRLLSPIDAEEVPGQPAPALYVNLLDLDRHTIDAIYLGTAVVIGLGFILLMPPRSRRTPRSDIAEWCILTLLVVVATPVARSYYFVWLLWPYIVLARRAATETDRRLARATAAAIALSIVLMAASMNEIKPHWAQAIGILLWAVAVAIAALAVEMRRAMAASPPAGVAPEAPSRVAR